MGTMTNVFIPINVTKFLVLLLLSKNYSPVTGMAASEENHYGFLTN